MNDVDTKQGTVRRAGPPIAPRTRRGLVVAAIVGAIVLFYLHGVRTFMADNHWSVHFDEDLVSGLKAALAFGALGFSIYEIIRRLSKNPLPKRYVAIVLCVLGGLGGFAFLSSDDMTPGHYTHNWEFFHYYLGSKYGKELGYKRLYICAAVAQSELGASEAAEVKGRKLRDLETDVLVPAAPVLDDPDACKSHFTGDQWEKFRADIQFFRSNASKQYWDQMQEDHGYNPPPMWTTFGHIFSSLTPASVDSLKVLACIDPLLYTAIFFLLWWAFGLRVMCIALVFFGAQFPANGYFTGGAFIREDWLFWLVLSMCLARKHYWFASGFALVFASMLRIFPAIFVLGWVVVAATHFIRERGSDRPLLQRFKREHVRLFAGCAVATVLLGGVSVAATSLDSYKGFVHHIELHNRTPLTNNMGLAQLLSYSAQGRMAFTKNEKLEDPFSIWSKEQRSHLESRRLQRWATVLAVLGFFVAVVRRNKLVWVAQGLGCVLLVVIAHLTCYYYSFFLLAAPLARHNRQIEMLLLGAGGMSALIIVWPRVSYWWDDRYNAQSVVFLALGLALLAAFAREPPVKQAAEQKKELGASTG
jgi:hypothetical protein